MNVSMNWLKELVQTNISATELAKLFNVHSAEVEAVSKLVDADLLIVGKVLKKEPHENADKLSVCQVDLGDKVSQIVCGAPNVQENQHVIVALPGAVLPGNFKIKSSTIRGVESNGMICSLPELGIDKKYANADGIYVIREKTKAGDNPLHVLSLDDEILSIDITPNRADLLSMLGVAYDASAILEKPLTLTEYNVNEISKVNPVKIKISTDNCQSYYARVIENITIKPSPRWMQSRLIAAGVRPINNVVDITNYVMLETGQPLHAFDYELLGTDLIDVRMAKTNEILITLDEQKRQLESSDIVITNGKKAIALGGVMGGFDTEVSSSTTSILLESAVFNPSHVRKTSQRLDLRSEASIRFERKVAPKRTLLALEMATVLFEKYASGNTLKGISKVDNIDYSPLIITTSAAQINANLGSHYSVNEITSVLDRLNFIYQVQGDEIVIEVPSRRQDIETYQDVVEEVGRLTGYDKLPVSLPKTVNLGQLTSYQVFKRNLKSVLTALGLTEVVTYALMQPERNKDFDLTSDQPVSLLMPMSMDKSELKLSQIPGLVDVVAYNKARKNNDLFIFELGTRYQTDHENKLLSGAMTGVYTETTWQGEKDVVDFFTVKGILETMFEAIGLSHLKFEKTDAYPNLHPGQSAIIKDFKGTVGFVGKLHPLYEKKYAVKNVFVFELDVDKMFEYQRPTKSIKEVNKYPSIERDLSIIINQKYPAQKVIDIIEKAGKRMLNEVHVFDMYQGEPLPEDEKSLSVRLVFTDSNRTLETKEVDDRVAEILSALESKIKAYLRKQ
jgi:phenylalanyl-tRNA synthetase beta chain